MKKKDEKSAFIAYKKTEHGLAFFLQKRDMHALRSPGIFSLFGGGVEQGESPEQALIREIQEELTYTPIAFDYFSKYETANTIFYMFIEEVLEDFESKTEVREGEYGAFLTYSQMQKETVSPIAMLVARELTEILEK